MYNEDIVIFSSDDWGWKTSKYQLSIRFARDNRVLFVSSIGFRASSGSSQDVGRMFGKLKAFFRGVRKIRDNLYVLTPLIIPFSWFPFRETINLAALRCQVWLAMRYLRMRRPVVFAFSQNWFPYIRGISRQLMIYYRVDEHSGFGGLDQQRFDELDRQMARAADLIISSARSLQASSLEHNAASHYLPHGVDYDLFASALDAATPPARELESPGHPLLIFIGHVSYDWVDTDLIKYLAASRPDWRLVLVGRYSISDAEFEDHANVVVLGEKPYESLPGYCKIADLGLIPFVDTELTRNCHPLKLPEYIAAGLPVVSTDIPEVTRSYPGYAYIGRDREEFLQACDLALRENDPARNIARSGEMQQRSWDNRVGEIYRLIRETNKEAAGAVATD